MQGTTPTLCRANRYDQASTVPDIDPSGQYLLGLRVARVEPRPRVARRAPRRRGTVARPPSLFDIPPPAETSPKRTDAAQAEIASSSGAETETEPVAAEQIDTQWYGGCSPSCPLPLARSLSGRCPGPSSPGRPCPSALLAVVVARAPRGSYLAVPETVREALLSWAPVLGEVPALMALVQLYIFGTPDDVHDGYTVAPHGIVYASCGLPPSARGRREPVLSGDLLDLLCCFVDPALAVTDPDHRNERARAVRLEIPDPASGLIRRFLEDPESFDGERRVELIRGRATGRRDYRLERLRQRRAEAEARMAEAEASAMPVMEATRTIWRYTQASHCDGLFRTLPFAAARHVVRQRRPPFDQEHTRDCARRALAVMGDHPVQLYEPCENSPRLKHDPEGRLCGLARPARDALMTDGRDVGLDLDKAHLAALVPVARRYDLDTPETRAALTNPTRDVWQELADLLDSHAMPNPVWRRTAAKKSYSCAYGASADSVAHFVAEEYRRLSGSWVPDGAARGVLDQPVIAEVLEVSATLMELMTADGGAFNAEGQWVPLSAIRGRANDEERARTLLADVNASYEQAVMGAVYGEAADEIAWAAEKRDRRPRFLIWGYLFDGVIVRVNGKISIDRVVWRLQRAASEKARELGMPTRLSVK